MPADTIDVSTAHERRQEGRARLVDVRSPAEYEGMHIPGAYNVPLDRIEEYADELGRTDAENLVLVCRSGNRAEEAREALAANGVPEARVLDGGITAWREEGREIEEGRKRWSIERQVRFTAGFLVVGGAALGGLVSEAFYGLSAFVGAGLMFAALTDTCAMGLLIARMPHNQKIDGGTTAESEVRRLLRDVRDGREAASARGEQERTAPEGSDVRPATAMSN